MPLPDERPRQSVANLIGKFEQGGKRGSSSNGVGVARRESQGVLGSTAPTMPLKAQYTGQSTSAISVQSGPRSPPFKASELANTTGTDVPSWRKTTLPQATVPPAPEILQPETAPVIDKEGQETTSPTIMEQKSTYEEPNAVPTTTEPEQISTPNEPTTSKPLQEKTTKVKRPISNAGISNTAKPKAVTSGPSRMTKAPPSSRPSTLSKATASGAAKTARPSVVHPPAAPLKPQHTGGSATANRLSAPTASSKARVAGPSSSSGIKRVATGPTAASPPRKVVPKSTPIASSASAPMKKAPLPRTTAPASRTTASAIKRPAVPSTSTARAPPGASASKPPASSKTPVIKPMTAPRVGLAGAGRVKNPSGPAKLVAAGGLTASAGGAALLQAENKEPSVEEPKVDAYPPQELGDAAVDPESQSHADVVPEVIVESVDEPGDETIMQKSEAQDETEGHTASHEEPTEEHLDEAGSHEEPTEEHLDELGSHEEPEEPLIEADNQDEEEHVYNEENALSETAQEDAELFESVGHDDHHEGEVSIEGEVSMEVESLDPERENYDEQPLEEGEDHDEATEEQGQGSASPPPASQTEELADHTSTPSEGGGDLEDAVALLEGGHPSKLGHPVDLFSPGYEEKNTERGATMAVEASPNPSQREVGDIPDE